MTRTQCTLIAATALLAALAGCQKEVSYIGPPEVRIDAPPATLIGRSKILQDDKPIGTLRTYRFEDENAQHIQRVYDLRDESLGFVTQDGRAYRYTAHGGTVLVANSPDLRRNIAAIFGMPTAPFEIQPEAGTVDGG